MRYIRHASLIAMAVLLSISAADTVAANSSADRDEGGVRTRVARITLLSGDVQVRRAGSSELESAAVNLPLVEGDLLATGSDARLEVQIDAYNFVRVGENSLLSIVTLRKEGVALSLSEGTAIVRLARFDRESEYFEVDAPKTTVAAESRGLYRLDAGGNGNDRVEVRITVRDGGRARIYSETSGFILRDGRTARLVFDGTDASGDWELAAALSEDAWDRWNDQREYSLAQRLRYERRDRYYDSGVWGAEELDAYGDWINTGSNGYVWRPYASVTNNYYNWAPYRHGYWRWCRPYGWVWIGSEPWGWAPYHYGRWVYYNGSWCWSPRNSYSYGYSWWHPALVVFVYVNNSYGQQVCWYPLPPHQPNPVYATGGIKPIPTGPGGANTVPPGTGGIKPIPTGPGGTNTVPPGTGGVRPIPTRPEGPTRADQTLADTDGQNGTALSGAYLNAVTTLQVNDFGTTKPPVKSAPLSLAQTVITSQPVTVNELPVKTPKTLSGTGPLGTSSETSPNRTRGRDGSTAPLAPTGATKRKPGVELDGELRKTRVYNGREPLSPSNIRSDGSSTPSVRGTGAVKRPEDFPIKQSGESVEPIRPVRPVSPTKSEGQSSEDTVQPVRPTRPPGRFDQDPVRVKPPVRQPPEPPPPPKYEPPPRHDPPPKYEPPPRHDPPPKYEPPPRHDPPPKYEPPMRNDPPPKSEPPSKPNSDSSNGKKGSRK